MTDLPLLNAVIFAVVGVAVFAAAFALLAKAAPFNLWQEIVRERNLAAAIFAGAVALGICWIVASAMH